MVIMGRVQLYDSWFEVRDTVASNIVVMSGMVMQGRVYQGHPYGNVQNRE